VHASLFPPAERLFVSTTTAPEFARLRVGRERPASRRAAEKAEKFTSPHVRPQAQDETL
jgi:hypothetical protein